ncbi:endo-1,4-beta-xylanase [Actinotalea sp. AC32]|nr:endo-1,4-beta-xylanase [Actinotalea sp. AC32]
MTPVRTAISRWGTGLLALVLAGGAAPTAFAAPAPEGETAASQQTAAAEVAAAAAVISTDFEDGTTAPWTASGGPSLEVVDVDGGRALSVSDRTAGHDGIETSLTGVLTPGEEYTFSFRARLADGTEGASSMHLTAVEQGAGDPAYVWIGGGTDVTSAGWTDVTATYTLPAGLDSAKVYLEGAAVDGAFPSYLVDDLVVTGPSDGPPDGGGDGTVVVGSTFEGDLDGWTARGDGSATAALVAGGHESDGALQVTGRTQTWNGVQRTVALEAGATYDLSVWVRMADGEPTSPVTLSAELDVEENPWTNIATASAVGPGSWAQISATYTVPAQGVRLLYLESSNATASFLVDDVRVTAQEVAVEPLTPIKDTVDFPVGVAIDERETTGAPSELLLRHFDQITGENHMKPYAWYAEDRTFRPDPQATTLMEYAQANDLRVYGHTLVWHSQTPDWFFQRADGTPLTTSAADQEVLRERMRTHIFSVAEHLAETYGEFGSTTNPLVAWDVVNEVVADQGGDDGLRRSEWYRVLGPQFIDLAFRYADEAFNTTYAADGTDRPVTLFINDYNTEDAGKAQRLLALVERLIADGVPVDGVGHQFHVSLSRSVGDLEAAIELFADLTTADGDPLLQVVSELDVTTGTPVTQRNLVEQGYYYRDVFAMLREHAAELYSVTVWGLTDGRSWRVDSGAPLLFTDALAAKQAYYGVAEPENLQPRQQAANVFRGVVALDDAAPDADVWGLLPQVRVGEDAGFGMRWAPDHLTVRVEVADATDDATDAVELLLEGGSVTVARDDASGDDRVVRSTDEGWVAVVRLPLAEPVAEGSTLSLDVRVTDGATTTAWNSEGAVGTLTLVEELSVTDVVAADAAPTVDGVVDDVWADAQTFTTHTQVQGEPGASAVVRTLWHGDRLYVLARVSDPVLDSSASDPWEDDSVEIFLDMGNVKNGSYRYEDNQLRISFENVRSFGTGDEAYQDGRLESATDVVTGGYVVEAAIDLGDAGGLGSVHGLDVQVNDATDGSRTSVRTWADPTGLGYQSPSRWGVARLVDEASAPYRPGVVTLTPSRVHADWRVAPLDPTCVPVAGTAGVPEDATGVVLNVTTVRPTGPGHVVVYPGGPTTLARVPNGSTVNFEPGEDVASSSFVGLADGEVCYVTRGSRAGVLLDVTGYVTADSGVVTQAPRRLLDTRPGPLRIGDLDGLAPREEHAVQVVGEARVPEGATGALVTVTVVRPTSVGNLRLYPEGGDVPVASTINYVPGQDKANATLVALPESGRITLWSDSSVEVDVVVDVVGWVRPGASLTPVAPVRVVDTRPGSRTGPLSGPLTGRTAHSVQLADLGPLPVDATTAVLNVTAVRPTTVGNLRVYPDAAGGGSTPPDASSVNYVPGRDIPNMVVVEIPTSGVVTFWSDVPTGGQVHLVVDVVGYVAPVQPAVPEEEPVPTDPPTDVVPGGAVDPTATPVSAARGDGDVAALTFDDGPNPGETEEVLDLLAEHDIQAVFCVIGQNIEAAGGAEILRRMVDEGHTLCNHTTSYADMGSWTPAQVQADLVENLRIIREALGDPEAAVPYFRAPNGSWGRTPEVAVALGMQPLAVTNTISDWETQDEATLTAALRSAMVPGELVLVHDGGGDRAGTVAAVRTVVSERLADGWTFTLPVGGAE